MQIQLRRSPLLDANLPDIVPPLLLLHSLYLDTWLSFFLPLLQLGRRPFTFRPVHRHTITSMAIHLTLRCICLYTLSTVKVDYEYGIQEWIYEATHTHTHASSYSAYW